MAIAFDAITESATFTADTSFSHIPVAAPSGIIIYIGQNGTSADEVDSVLYGGIACTRQVRAVDTATEPMATYGYFLGSSIPTGTQTVEINETGGTIKIAYVISITAAQDTSVDTSGQTGEDQADPVIALTTTAVTYVTAAIMSGIGTPAGIDAGTGFTKATFGVLGNFDFGNQCIVLEDNISNFAAGSVNVAFNTGTITDDVAMVAMAVREGAGTTPTSYVLLPPYIV